MENNLNFNSKSQAASGVSEPWLTGVEACNVELAIPKVFGGPGKLSSPEDLFSLALLNCLVGTFKVLAKNSKLSFESLKATGSLELAKNGPYAFSVAKLSIHVVLTKPSSEKKAQVLLKKACDSGILLSAVKFPVEMTFELN